ncbi:MAG: hypothetical protein HYV07_06550 [Deltaproteobacteria bacterium]|nr:hypothetical protein [Deltaproteobacteria bacterium]
MPRGQHWSTVWPSAIALSRWLIAQTSFDGSTDSKELGCGTGLVSMTLSHLGWRAEATDNVGAALSLASINAAANDVEVSVSHLEWAEPEGASSSFILGSDIVYEAGAPAWLFGLIETSRMLRPDGQLVLACPAARRDLLDELKVAFTAVGYSHREEAQETDWRGRSQQIDIHVFRRPSGSAP